MEFRPYSGKSFCARIIGNEKNIFYYDDTHPSLKGAEMINDLIIKEIEKIVAKYN